MSDHRAMVGNRWMSSQMVENQVISTIMFEYLIEYDWVDEWLTPEVDL